MDDIIIVFLEQAAYTLAAFLVGYFLSKSRSLISHQHNVERGMRTLLKAELRQIHERATKNNYISYADEAMAQEVYDSYHALRGNGQGTNMIADIHRIPKVP